MYRPRPEELEDINVPMTASAAGSVEPMPRADHKAKKHSRPKMKIKNPRRGEKLGGGHFVFRRQEHGRITPNGQPYEHPSYDSAYEEAVRRQELHGGTFEVYSRSAIVDGVVADGDWDRAPVSVGSEAREAA